MEWEFSPDSDGDGKFMMSGRALGNLRNRLGKGDIDGALAIYREGSNELGRDLVAEFGTSSRQLQKHIANLFYRSGEYMRAAACAEILAEWGAAARAFESAGRLEDAARCYGRAGDSDRAEALAMKAASAPKNKKPDKTDLFHDAEDKELSGKLIEAAELYRRAGHKDRATSVLSRIPKSSKDGSAAAVIGSDLLVERGQIDQAIEMLKEALPEDRVVKNAQIAEVAYRLAVLYQQKGHRGPAESTFEMIVGFDPNYKDVTQRMMDTSLAKPRQAAPVAAESKASVKRREIQEGKRPERPPIRARPGALAPSVVGVVRGSPATPEPRVEVVRGPDPGQPFDPVALAVEEERRALEAKSTQVRREEPDDDDAPPRAAMGWYVQPLAPASEPPPTPMEPRVAIPKPLAAPAAEALNEPEESTHTQFEEDRPAPPDESHKRLPAEIEASIASIRSQSTGGREELQSNRSLGTSDERTEARSMLPEEEETGGTEEFEDEATVRGVDSDAPFRGRDIDASELAQNRPALMVSDAPEPSADEAVSEPAPPPRAQAPRPSREEEEAEAPPESPHFRTLALRQVDESEPDFEAPLESEREEPRRLEPPRIPEPQRLEPQRIEPRAEARQEPLRPEPARVEPLRPEPPRAEPKAEAPRAELHEQTSEPRRSLRRDPDPPSTPTLVQVRRRRRMLDPFASLNRELGLAIDPASAFGVDPIALEAAARMPAFEELSKSQVAELLELGDEVEYRAGHVLASRGHNLPGLIIVIEGRTGPAETGPVIGALALFDEVPSEERVVAIDTVRALFLPRSRFLEMMTAHPRRAVPIFAAFTRLLLRERLEARGGVTV